tara:strand:- start:336 stop:626 length:291 start_codon:yes stop_codon:yes gene_type:complete
MAEVNGEKPWWESIKTSLTAPSTPEDQAKAMKLAALLQAQGDSGLETTAYKGIHAMPSAAAGFGNALLKGVSGYMSNRPDPLAAVSSTPMIKIPGI